MYTQCLLAIFVHKKEPGDRLMSGPTDHVKAAITYTYVWKEHAQYL